MAKRAQAKERMTPKDEPRDEPSLLDLAKGLGKPKPKAERKPRKPKAKPPPPKDLPTRYLVIYRRRGPAGVDPVAANIEPGDFVTFWHRDGATVTRTVADTRAQTLCTEPYVLSEGDESYAFDQGLTVNLGRVYEVLRSNPDWTGKP